ncbi:MAG: helix-turn-helix transcriptional regulator [Bacteroidota bacterium]
MKRYNLGEFEEIVLLWVSIQNEEAYGLSITEAIRDKMNRSVTLSSVHTALYRLEEKGFVQSGLGGASSKRGGRRKRIFSVTNAGKEALLAARAARTNLWDMMPDGLFGFSE